MSANTELLKNTPGLTQVGNRWKVQAYLTPEAALWVVHRMAMQGCAAGRAVADVVEVASRPDEEE
jgi:hypothetical protein